MSTTGIFNVEVTIQIRVAADTPKQARDTAETAVLANLAPYRPTVLKVGPVLTDPGPLPKQFTEA